MEKHSIRNELTQVDINYDSSVTKDAAFRSNSVYIRSGVEVITFCTPGTYYHKLIKLLDTYFKLSNKSNVSMSDFIGLDNSVT